MICKKAIKNAVIFTAMLLIVGINSTPLISKAGNSFGVAFSVDGETTFTDTQSKSTSSSVQMLCTDKDIDGSYYYGKVYAYKSGQYYDVSHGYEYYFDPQQEFDRYLAAVRERFERRRNRCRHQKPWTVSSPSCLCLVGQSPNNRIINGIPESGKQHQCRHCCHTDSKYIGIKNH